MDDAVPVKVPERIDQLCHVKSSHVLSHHHRHQALWVHGLQRRGSDGKKEEGTSGKTVRLRRREKQSPPGRNSITMYRLLADWKE